MSSPYCVPEESYQQLIDKLQAAVPKSLSMIGSLRNALRGRLTANFYVDKWPDFTAVVCQYIWPRRSDVADIGAYATSSEALLSVLIEGNLVTWGKRQEFQRIEDRHADYLLTKLKPPGSNYGGLKCIHERTCLYNDGQTLRKLFDGNISAEIDKIATFIPDGFVLGKLHPHHAKMVSSIWPRLNDWPNKELYFKELIKSFNCPAIYSVENLDEPVSYNVQFPCNQGFGYTDKKYKGKRLFSLPGLYLMIDVVLVNGYVPWEQEVSHSGRISFAQMRGAILSGYCVKDLVTSFVIDSKL